MALPSMRLSGTKYFVQGTQHASRWKASVFSNFVLQEDFFREPLKTPSLGRSTFPAKPWLFQDSVYPK